MPPSGRAITVRKAEPMVGWCLFEYYREKAEKLKTECEAAVERPKTTSAIGSMACFTAVPRTMVSRAYVFERGELIASGAG